MYKKILSFNTYSAALNSLAGIIDKRKVDLSVRHIVITPEKYTLLLERLLFKNNNGAFDVEVYSPDRLYYKLGGGFCLPKEGAVMILKQILNGCELKCFNRSKKHRGFCERLYKTITDFILYEVSADNLKNEGIAAALKLKLDDIKYVYSEFLKRTAGIRTDRHGKLESIKEALTVNPGIFKNANVYIVNFDYITKLEEEIFDLIAAECLSFNHFAVCGQPPVVPCAEIYSAPDAPKAIKAAAKRILAAANNGVKLSDMCLVCASESLLPAKRIFNEYGIPLYTNEKEKLSVRPLTRYLLTLLKLKIPSRTDYVALSKNPCAGIDTDDSDIFANYCARFLIDYIAFNEPFKKTDPDNPDENERKTAEKVRHKLHAVVSSFWKELEKADSAKAFGAVIQSRFSNYRAAPCHHSRSANDIKYSALGSFDSGILRQSFNCIDNDKDIEANDSFYENEKAKLIEILSLMEKTFDTFENSEKQTKITLSFLIEAFIEGIESARLSSLPAMSECLIASGPAAFRGDSFKYAFILDFNEGIIPASAGAEGVLNKGDAALLRNAGIESGLSSDELNELGRGEILRLMAASKKLFISYLKTDDLRPSPLIYSLNNNMHFFNSYEAEQVMLQENDAEFLSLYAGCPSSGLEYLLLSATEPTALTSALYDILYKTADAYLNDGRDNHPGINAEMFFDRKNISASRLQTYFECPYKHFVRYGLKVKEKPDGQAGAPDAGIVIHKMAEKFVRSGLNEDELDRILDETPFGYKYDLPQNLNYKEKLKKEIKKLCLIFAANVKNGAFIPLGAEIKLNELPQPVHINGLTLKGSIDYADVYGAYARIIDYKSGGGQFEEKTLYHGVKLQLPLYMHALLQNGYRPAAMQYFKFKSKWEDGEYRFTGIFNSDPDVVQEMDSAIDKTGESQVLSAKLKTDKDGNKKITGTGAKSEEEIKAYCDYAVSVSSLAVKQIQSGNIAPSPYYKDSRRNACFYCAYKPACAYTGGFRHAVKECII